MNAPRPRTTHSSSSDARLSRRTFLMSGTIGLAATFGAVGPATSAAAANNYSVIPRLPGEVSRYSTRYTDSRGIPYESIDVSYGGDLARVFVPWSTPRTTAGISVCWFYHSNMADRTALHSAYRYPAGLLADRGWVSICPDFGGSLWTSQGALDRHANWVTWMSSTFSVAKAYSRANSGGSPLMCWAYGKNMIPGLRGIYLCNGAYDMTDLYERDPVRVRPVYRFDKAAMQRTDPARLPASAWAGKRIRVAVSAQDTIVPPAKHGMALIGRAAPVAASASARWHDLGHENPSWANSDMVSTFESWG